MIVIDKNEFIELMRRLIRETLIEVLTQRKDLLEDVFLEAMEDIGLARAIEDGRTGEIV